MDGQIRKVVQEERAHRAADVAAQMEEDYLNGLVGSVLPVLFEEEKNGLWQGHAPNYVAVRARGKELHNCLCNVRVTAVEGGMLRGEIEV